MPRARTPKGIAKRIELQYFKRLHPLRRWKLILTIAAPAIAGGWLIVLAVRGDQSIYTSGSVSTAHAMFGVQCTRCHRPASVTADQPGEEPTWSFWLRVSDEACLTCHDGPVHHRSQVVSPECTSCHVEHKGRDVLAFMSDRHCTSCHANLQTKDLTTPFERQIRGLNAGHPEFAVLVKEKNQARRIRLDDKDRLKDTAQVKLNHRAHLELHCTYCHKPIEQRAYMAPILYAKHCARCHQLDFDARLLELAPHDKPVIVRAFLREVYTSAFEQCQTLTQHGGRAADQTIQDLKQQCQELNLIKSEEKEVRRRARLGRRDEPVRRLSPKLWVASQMQRAEAVLFKQKCEYCHILTYGPEQLPEVARTAIPSRWLPHSRFDHHAHRVLACIECHKARESKETTDVLLPPIATCRECHRDSGGARLGCVQCHLYHDKTRERDPNGPFTIREMVSEASSPVVAGPARRGD